MASATHSADDAARIGQEVLAQRQAIAARMDQIQSMVKMTLEMADEADEVAASGPKYDNLFYTANSMFGTRVRVELVTDSRDKPRDTPARHYVVLQQHAHAIDSRPLSISSVLSARLFLDECVAYCQKQVEMFRDPEPILTHVMNQIIDVQEYLGVLIRGPEAHLAEAIEAVKNFEKAYLRLNKYASVYQGNDATKRIVYREHVYDEKPELMTPVVQQPVPSYADGRVRIASASDIEAAIMSISNGRATAEGQSIVRQFMAPLNPKNKR